MKIKAIVFDFNRTLYDPDADSLVPGALQALEDLSRKYPLVLYSKKGEGRDERIAELGLPRFFKKMVAVESKSGKDLESVARELGIKPQEIVVVGDRVRSELRAGREAGCATIWFRRGKFSQEGPEKPGEEPGCEITGLAEIAGAVEKMSAA